jgi:hypothetical protein
MSEFKVGDIVTVPYGSLNRAKAVIVEGPSVMWRYPFDRRGVPEQVEAVGLKYVGGPEAGQLFHTQTHELGWPVAEVTETTESPEM